MEILLLQNKILVFSALLFFSCVSSPRYTSGKGINHQVGPRYTSQDKKTSNANTVNQSIDTFKGISSYYGTKFHGKLTANGEVYDMYGLTAAHKTLPLNTIIRVTNLSNGMSQILRVNDRGPYIDGRILDCSYGAAKKLGFLEEGTTEVEVVVVEWGDNKYMHH